MLLETTADSLTGIAAWAVGIMTALGGPGAALLIALENLFPPLPSEVFLPLAGFSAGTGSSSMTVLSAILWCTSGSVVGAWALYGVGAWLGRERTRRILAKMPLVKTSDIDRTEAFFQRWGGWTVFTGRHGAGVPVTHLHPRRDHPHESMAVHPADHGGRRHLEHHPDRRRLSAGRELDSGRGVRGRLLETGDSRLRGRSGLVRRRQAAQFEARCPAAAGSHVFSPRHRG